MHWWRRFLNFKPMSNEKIKQLIQGSINTKEAMLNNEALVTAIHTVAQAMVLAFQQDKKVLFCGNGGSAADAQHIAAELSGRFYKDREPLFAEALTVNSSYVTAVANDYSFDEVFARLVRSKGREGDVLVAISTSGNSPNITRAIEDANALNMVTVGFTGESGGAMKVMCDHLINIPSTDTPRIQEAHILVGHILCELVEEQLF